MREHPVLVVQHDGAVASRIGDELARSGLRVAGPVADLERAIARAEGQVVAAVLLDLWLPDSAGAETLVRFRARCPHAPVIATAPRASEDEARKAVAQGARFYLLHEEIGRGLVAPLVQECAGAATQGEAAQPQVARRLLHDLGNILAAVSGGSEMLLGRADAPEPLASDIRELHDVISEGVRVYRKLAATWRREVS